MKFNKHEKKTADAIGVEPGTFGSVERCVTDGATRLHIYE